MIIFHFPFSIFHFPKSRQLSKLLFQTFNKVFCEFERCTTFKIATQHTLLSTPQINKWKALQNVLIFTDIELATLFARKISKHYSTTLHLSISNYNIEIFLKLRRNNISALLISMRHSLEIAQHCFAVHCLALLSWLELSKMATCIQLHILGNKSID